MSVGPRSKKFNIVSNDHERTQKGVFCVSVYKTNFTDHRTPDTIDGFRDSVLACKCMIVTVRYAKISSISVHSYQVMQAIAMVRL